MMERFRLKRQIPISNFKSETHPENDDVVLPADDPFPPKLNITDCDDQRQATARLASSVSDYKGDYMDMPSDPQLLKILQKQGCRVQNLHGYMNLFIRCLNMVFLNLSVVYVVNKRNLAHWILKTWFVYVLYF
ncbi:hypothetical protein K1719_028199 [Acacia pycnantha]|nr:hypothetical protein K1719_028199 [Acacia pycnantha]